MSAKAVTLTLRYSCLTPAFSGQRTAFRKTRERAADVREGCDPHRSLLLPLTTVVSDQYSVLSEGHADGH